MLQFFDKNDCKFSNNRFFKLQSKTTFSEIETFMRKESVQDEFATGSSKDCFGPASGLPSSIAALFC